MSSFPSLDVDREACENIANACASSALAGIFVGAALTLARGRPASVLPTYALNTCANFTLVGTTYATALEAFARSNGGVKDAPTNALAGSVTGGGAMWAYRGRGGAAAGALAGGAAALAAAAVIDFSASLEEDGDGTEAGGGFEFPSWSPIQIVREEDPVDEGELRARMDAAMRGELSAKDEAQTREDFLKWKMRRASSGRS